MTRAPFTLGALLGAVLLLSACPKVDHRSVRPGAEPAVFQTAVVRQLGSTAEAERTAGRLDNAATFYERALRIEPYNGHLWHGLARVRYGQQSFRQALALAAKSNTLAGGDRALMMRNWKLIGDAHLELGEEAAARAAYARAEGLEPRGLRRLFD